MEYYKLLNLEKEPFSNSPDPDCFFKSRQHKACLQKLELSLRLRRGLNVVIGEVGTGKTTLCRQLIKRFSRDEAFETHLILDPHMTDPAAFLKVVAGMFEREPHAPAGDWADHKEFIKQYLYKRGVEENRVVVLIIDEGQKIPAPILEILRELLNYETNEFKLLQIVIFAQREFEQVLERHANFADRINLLHVLGPLGFTDTRLMIDYRLQKAGAESSLGSMLSFPALLAIYRATKGYPRKIVNLCHRIMLAMIVKNRKKAGWRLVRSCVNSSSVKTSGVWRKAIGVLLVVVGVAGIAYTGFMPVKEDTGRKTVSNKAFPVKKESVLVTLPDATVTKKDLLPAETTVAEPTEKAVAQPARAATAAQPVAVNEPVAEKAPVPAARVPEAGAPAKEVQTAKKIRPEAHTDAVVRSRPETLGLIRLRDNETLSWAMIKVYGEYTNFRRRQIAASNPGLRDLDNIFSGQAIAFPAGVQAGLRLPGFLRWIRVDSVETVSAALDAVRRYSTKEAPLRIIARWHREQGLRFDIIFWKYFSSQDEAARYLADLPDGIRMKSTIFAGWKEDTVFYANPCPGIG